MGRDATDLLSAASKGNHRAAAQLMPLIYEELREIARRQLAKRGPGDAITLQPTAVVHEVFLRLVDRKTADVHSRTHFYALAAVAVRHVLIDHVRGRRRAKRGGDWRRISLADAVAVTCNSEVDLLALDEVLSKLAELDERAAKVVELRFFAGLTEKDVADILDISERTVRNDWSMARAWLRCALSGKEENPP